MTSFNQYHVLKHSLRIAGPAPSQMPPGTVLRTILLLHCQSHWLFLTQCNLDCGGPQPCYPLMVGLAVPLLASAAIFLKLLESEKVAQSVSQPCVSVCLCMCVSLDDNSCGTSHYCNQPIFNSLETLDFIKTRYKDFRSYHILIS